MSFGQLEPVQRSVSPVASGRSPLRGRGLRAIEYRTTLRRAAVIAEGLVQIQKVHEIDAVTREAMSGHALLVGWRDTLAAGDVLLADELRFFTDAARLGSGEVIADLVDSYCRESRR